ncbi:EnvZ/OmpR regulon moderator MzrA [Erwinia sp. 9145]|uniref:EnvZ/OmpR regulon moderator MzrA n=1 Tax=Erwinia sp. 9145 TaxID=1500895 RepID=UPI0005599F9C|nr:EnvZ/OmpR regulon moderator MzrA [Erwinia sp. 9145]
MLTALRSRLTRRAVAFLLAGALVLLLMTTLPMLFHNDTALKIEPSRQGVSLPDGFYVWQRLSAQGIHIKSITPDNNTLIIQFESSEQSAAAEKVLRQLLPYDFEIAQVSLSGMPNPRNKFG